MLNFSISSWVAIPPDLAAGAAGTPPMATKRRATAIGRKALDAAWAVIPPGTGARLVLSSRHGEYARTWGLLRSLVEDGTVSPADFSMSVHHALVGLLSIATGNRAGHTAVAAGADSFCYGMLEAATCAIEDGRPVVLIHYDEPLPDCYGPVSEPDPPALALAVVIAPGGGEALEFTVGPAARPPGAPQDAARAFLDFLQSGAAECVVDGERLAWRWRRAA